MIISAHNMFGLPVVSLTGSGQIAKVTGLLIDPTTCKVIFVRVLQHKNTLYLPLSEVRDFSTEQLIVNTENSLTAAEDLVRHQALIHEPCELFKFRVVTVMGHKLGHCSDYIFDIETHLVVKLYVTSTLLQRFLTSHFVIDQADIVKIHDRTITVKDAVVTELKRLKVKEPLPAQNT